MSNMPASIVRPGVTGREHLEEDRPDIVAPTERVGPRIIPVKKVR